MGNILQRIRPQLRIAGRCDSRNCRRIFCQHFHSISIRRNPVQRGILAVWLPIIRLRNIAVFIGPRPQCHALFRIARKLHNRLTVERHFHLHAHLSVPADLIIADIVSRNRIVTAFHFSQADVRMGRDHRFCKSRLQRTDAGCVSVYKFHHGAVRIMVQGVHPGVADGPVLSHRVPPLPDGGSPQVDAVEPAWETFL